MRKVCSTCGRPGSEGGICSDGYHIVEAYAELEEAKELLELLENGMGVEGVLNGGPIKGVLMTPEYIARVQEFLKRLRDNARAKPVIAVCDEYTGGDTVIKLAGGTESFRCHCGGNVFSKHATEICKYRCNSCGSIYEGEK